jgi:4-amino-4-deoxy-L-arabinose transferase-like glycosyltransferase
VNRNPLRSPALAGRRPWWAIAGLAAIAALALGLYTWSLDRNGMANSYYAAAVKSATVSWKAFLFGSLDPGSFITVDKPPASIWLMAVFSRVFGFSSWSMLIPQALTGMASVLTLHHLVRRWAGDIAALLAALALALTPVAVLIFRYNNPDALLTLLLLLSTWGLWSALECSSSRGATWRLALAGVALGLAFLTKMLMAFLVVPAFVLVYLLCGRGRLAQRALQLTAPVGALVVTGGWWLALVSLWPDSTRPYVGGTTGNSWFELILGRAGGYLGSTTSAGHMSGNPGLLRVFNTALGGQVSWLLPLGLAGLVAGLWVTRRAARTDRLRAGYLLWGLWTVVMIVVFGFVRGTFHSYYTVVLAPAVAALAGTGSLALWRLTRSRRWLAWLLPVVVAGSTAWSAVLLGRVSGYAPGLAVSVVVLGTAGAAALLVIGPWPRLSGLLRSRTSWIGRASAAGVAALCLVALLAGPLAYDLSTVSRSVTGNSAAAGPGAAAPGRRAAGGAPPRG